MFTITNHKKIVLAALTLWATLALGIAMAMDAPINATIKDAVDRNDPQLLTDVGGASFTKKGAETAINPEAFNQTMQQAFKYNDSQLLPESFEGGANFNESSAGSMVNPAAYYQTMNDAFRRHDSQLLPESFAGGASFMETPRKGASPNVCFKGC